MGHVEARRRRRVRRTAGPRGAVARLGHLGVGVDAAASHGNRGRGTRLRGLPRPDGHRRLDLRERAPGGDRGRGHARARRRRACGARVRRRERGGVRRVGSRRPCPRLRLDPTPGARAGTPRSRARVAHRASRGTLPARGEPPAGAHPNQRLCGRPRGRAADRVARDRAHGGADAAGLGVACARAAQRGRSAGAAGRPRTRPLAHAPSAICARSTSSSTSRDRPSRFARRSTACSIASTGPTTCTPAMLR